MRRQLHSLRVKSGLSRLQPVYSNTIPKEVQASMCQASCPSCVHAPLRFSTLTVSCCLATGAEEFSRSFSISKSPTSFVFLQLTVHTSPGELCWRWRMLCRSALLGQTLPAQACGITPSGNRAERNLPAGAAAQLCSCDR